MRISFFWTITTQMHFGFFTLYTHTNFNTTNTRQSGTQRVMRWMSGGGGGDWAGLGGQWHGAFTRRPEMRIRGMRRAFLRRASCVFCFDFVSFLLLL